ncbi:aspartyl protease family protein [Telluribacter sp. SYSU D00476]|uniref:aspartyl protease family protein n=1 Tax=Telluribacter sp. SYSU D00476 TaxID=2811430 RepID=UPI001FF607F7|nr:aspartyl protease family protein [Telluribacter sp. SYSU D00476]
MIKLLFLLAASLFYLIPICSRAQQKAFGFHLVQQRKSVRVPFKLHANLVIVPVQINNSDTLHFILDSGVSTIIVTDPEIAKFVDKGYTRTVTIDGVGNEASRKATVSIGNTFRMPHIQAFDQNLVVLENDMLKLSEFLGTPIHGIFGYELFERFVITIDFRRQELILRPPEHYQYRRKYGDKLPIQIENRRPYLSTVQITDRGEKKNVQMLLDTGAGHALMLDTYSSNVSLPDKVVRVQLGVGLGGAVSGHLGRLPKLQVGRFELHDVLSSFPDNSSFGAKINSMGRRQGNIGGELLRRFVVTFHYKGQYVVLKPIKSALRETFEHDMSGLELRAKGDKYNSYVVDHVKEDSPAYYAGVQKDDKLMFINSTPASNLSLTEINKTLQRKEGKEIDLVLKRGDELIVTSFVLKRII